MIVTLDRLRSWRNRLDFVQQLPPGLAALASRELNVNLTGLTGDAQKILLDELIASLEQSGQADLPPIDLPGGESSPAPVPPFQAGDVSTIAEALAHRERVANATVTDLQTLVVALAQTADTDQLSDEQKALIEVSQTVVDASNGTVETTP